MESTVTYCTDRVLIPCTASLATKKDARLTSHDQPCSALAQGMQCIHRPVLFRNKTRIAICEVMHTFYDGTIQYHKTEQSRVQ